MPKTTDQAYVKKKLKQIKEAEERGDHELARRLGQELMEDLNFYEYYR